MMKNILYIVCLFTFISLSSCTRAIDIELIEASDTGNIGKVRALIKQGGDVNIRSDDDWLTPLIAASRNGHLKVVKYLINSGANINKADGGGTPLYWAAFNGQIEIINYLLNNSAQFNCDAQSCGYLLQHIQEKKYLDIHNIVMSQLAKEK